nr:uncharacterized protein LOC127346740 [Lolium perenne]
MRSSRANTSSRLVARLGAPDQAPDHCRSGAAAPPSKHLGTPQPWPAGGTTAGTPQNWGQPPRDRRAEAPTRSMDLHATAASRHCPDANHPRAVQTPQPARRRRALGAAAPASPTPAENMPAPGTSSTSTLHEQHLIPSEPAKAQKRPALGNTSAPPSAAARSSTLAAAPLWPPAAAPNDRRAAQWPPAAARPAAEARCAARGCAEEPPSGAAARRPRQIRPRRPQPARSISRRRGPRRRRRRA